jgi:hypothetical protein
VLPGRQQAQALQQLLQATAAVQHQKPQQAAGASLAAAVADEAPQAAATAGARGKGAAGPPAGPTLTAPGGTPEPRTEPAVWAAAAPSQQRPVGSSQQARAPSMSPAPATLSGPPSGAGDLGSAWPSGARCSAELTAALQAAVCHAASARAVQTGFGGAFGRPAPASFMGPYGLTANLLQQPFNPLALLSAAAAASGGPAGGSFLDPLARAGAAAAAAADAFGCHSEGAGAVAAATAAGISGARALGPSSWHAAAQLPAAPSNSQLSALMLGSFLYHQAAAMVGASGRGPACCFLHVAL